MLFRLCQVTQWLTFLWLCFFVGALAFESLQGSLKIENIEAPTYLLFVGPYIAGIVLSYVITSQFKVLPWGLQPPPPKQN